MSKKESTNCKLCNAEFEFYPSSKKGVYCSKCVSSGEAAKDSGNSVENRYGSGFDTVDRTPKGPNELSNFNEAEDKRIDPDFHSKKKGEVTESIVRTKLMEMGYSISVPFSEDQRYDLILDIENKLYRVQIKHGRCKNGSVTFNTSSTRCNTIGPTMVNYTSEEIDCFIVYVSELDEFLWLNINEATSGKMSIRYQKTKVPFTHNINWITDFLLEDVLE